MICFHAIRNDIAYNEAEYGARTARSRRSWGAWRPTAGKRVFWDDALAKGPEHHAGGIRMGCQAAHGFPMRNGKYPVPQPGVSTSRIRVSRSGDCLNWTI